MNEAERPSFYHHASLAGFEVFNTLVDDCVQATLWRCLNMQNDAYRGPHDSLLKVCASPTIQDDCKISGHMAFVRRIHSFLRS